ncbi:MAG TPA: hypothetical protein VK982_12890, partial [Bacteroidales bacterium]|nr:hypothetical protein [Bacteroidales bacterium]
MFFHIILLLPLPLVTMYLIDNVLPNQNTKLLSIICVAVIIILALTSICSFYQRFYFTKYDELVILSIKNDLIKVYHQLS